MKEIILAKLFRPNILYLIIRSVVRSKFEDDDSVKFSSWFVSSLLFIYLFEKHFGQVWTIQSMLEIHFIVRKSSC